MLIWLAYFLVPNDAGGFVRGIPLGPIEAAALLMIAWLARIGTRLPGRLVVATLLAVTFIAGAAIPGNAGFRARYFANASASGPHERSTEFRGEAFTRIDRRLDFSPDGPEVPLPFINESNRFNFYKGGEPNRRYLAFAVRWSGLWWADEERPRLYLDAPSAIGEIFVDGVLALEVSPESGSPAILEVPVTRGWHRLDVTFASPYGSPRVFSSGVMDGDRRRPFDATMVLTQQVRPWQMTAARLLNRGKAAIDVALIASLAWLVLSSLVQIIRAQTRVLWLFSAAAAAEAFLFALRWSRHNMVLIGGDDTLTYEGYARDILLNGILMNGGLPPGQGEPFYYQAGYPYFLAAAHALFGESMFGPVLLQRLLAAVAMWKVVEIAMAWTSERIWVAALPIAVSFMAWKFWPIAAQPLNESVYVPLLLASAAALVHLCAQPRTRNALAAGLLSGLTTLTRSTALIAWAVVWPACWLAMKGRPGRTRVIATLVFSMLIVFSLITIRNLIVAGVFAPMPTELGITLRGGNEVPPDVTIDLSARSAIYQRFSINEHTATVIEYAITAPGRFAQNIGRKALFALGFYEPYAPGWGYSPVYIAVWTSAVAGLVLLLRQPKTQTAPRERVPYLIPALMALTQFIAVVIVYPKGERLIVPIHSLLLPYSAVAAWHLAQTAAALTRQRRASSPA